MRKLTVAIVVGVCVLALVAARWGWIQYSARDWYAKGNQAIAARHYDQAIADFTRAMEIDPGYTAALNRRGDARAYDKDYNGAMRDFDAAAAIDPRSPVAFRNRGRVKREQHDYAGSLAEYNVAVGLDKDDADSYFGRAFTRALQDDRAGAIADYTTSLALVPQSASAYNNRGSLEAKDGDFASAVADFTKAIQLEPLGASGLNSMAWLLATATDAKYRDGKNAVELAKTANSLTGWKSGMYLDTLAAAYARAGDFDHAVEWQQKALLDSRMKGDSGAVDRLDGYRNHHAFPPD